MAKIYVQDSTIPFTISLTALLEGQGILTRVLISNLTTGYDYEWTGVGGWTELPEATEGDSVRIRAYVFNNGDTGDIIYGKFEGLTSGGYIEPPEGYTQEAFIEIGFTLECIWTFIMPSSDVNVTIDGGHEE